MATFTNIGSITGLASITFSTGGCFIGSTPIFTNKGLVNIQNIQIGDIVLSFNPNTLELSMKEVTNVFVHEPEPYFTFTFSNGKSLGVTGNHPMFNYYTKTFVRADTMKVGDHLMTEHTLPTELVSITSQDNSVNVYNLEVLDNHTYFANGVGVHNVKP